MGYRTILILVLVLLLFAPMVSAQQEENTEMTVREIQGVVRSASGQPVAGATVYLESSVGDVLQQISLDSSGRFNFNVHKGTFYVRVVAAGFREYRARVDLNFLRRATVTVNLVPDSGEPGAQPAGPAVDKEYLQIPENARKEFVKASKLLKEKKPAESIGPFRKAISLHDNFPAAHFLLGAALMDLRRWPEAQVSLERAVALDDQQAAAHLALGTCLAQQGKFVEAEKPLKRGLELNPNTADGQLELGKVYWSQGRWQQAEPHARKSIELKHDIPLAHILLGNILLKKQDQNGALVEFKEYLRLDPNGPFAPGARDMVAKLEKAPAKP